MADQNPPTSKLQPPADASAPGEQNGKADEGKKKLPQLGALEDDDEFEWLTGRTFQHQQSGNILDAINKEGQENLWEDNWDDDDVEDDFTKQLRTAVQERAGGDEAMKD